MTKQLNFHIKELDSMKKYPNEIFYKGNTSLLRKRKISIVGTRKPNSYTKQITHKLANELSKREIIIVSGAAIGVDAISHNAAGSLNTIAVIANGLDIKYPAINSKLIDSIEKEGLILSTYKDGEKPRNYTFVHRNELVVALGEILIVTQADEKSGTLTSINYALEMGKKVYTIPHRLNESLGTQKLVEEGLIEPIYNLDKFLDTFGTINKNDSELDTYINSFPLYEEALKKYKEKIFELELEERIIIENGYIKPI
ncbi:DNA-processing protein DprA [Arcobacter sp. LA11]|uniref:DNA-processing protein DprA n=1 Tax=Arcobacter sp. LA11 TaxID=1898176 RepID=UPI000933E731|nr:DNA-processing protein DprA [Arcobacter sp. LA11]